MMRFVFHTLLCLTLVTGYAFANTTNEVKAIGEYSNIQTSMADDPHQSGYAVTLFRRVNGEVFGEFTYAPGTTEGFGGRLYEVKNCGRKLAFKAKVSAGQSSSGEPDKTLFNFVGTLGRSAIVGTISIWDGYDMKKPVRVEKVKLKRDAASGMSPEDYSVYLKFAPAAAW